MRKSFYVFFPQNIEDDYNIDDVESLDETTSVTTTTEVEVEYTTFKPSAPTHIFTTDPNDNVSTKRTINLNF